MSCPFGVHSQTLSLTNRPVFLVALPDASWPELRIALPVPDPDISAATRLYGSGGLDALRWYSVHVKLWIEEAQERD